MVKVNGEIVGCSRFPDGTPNIKGNPNLCNRPVFIEWNYGDDTEFIVVAFLKKYYQSHGCPVMLMLPYVPNARMDRVENPEDVFAAKYFCELINSLEFTAVYVVDPHSNVIPAVLKNCILTDMENAMRMYALEDIMKRENEIPILFYPDAGAMKRYSKAIPEGVEDIGFCYKDRDWKTGEIKGLDVFGIDKEKINGKNILIQDDICSKGGTFYYAALKLKELGAKNIYLLVSHCEESVSFGEFGEDKKPLLQTGLIEHLYTSNSIDRKVVLDKEKITVFDMGLRPRDIAMDMMDGIIEKVEENTEN